MSNQPAPLSTSDISDFSKIATDAYFQAYEIDRLTDKKLFSLEDAYRIQDSVLQTLVSKGDRIVGYKMGLTSQAKMRQMGVHSPIYGVITEKMKMRHGAMLPLEGRIHAKIEPEIAFILAKDLHGEVTPDQAMDACSGVCAAMEIIDSRYRNFSFTLPDVIADNCSSSAFVLGETIRKPREVDLGNLGILLEVDGKASQFGSSSAIYGHPAASLAELSAMLARRGHEGLKAGQIVLAGAATQAIPLERGKQVRASIQDLGFVGITAK